MIENIFTHTSISKNKNIYFLTTMSLILASEICVKKYLNPIVCRDGSYYLLIVEYWYQSGSVVEVFKNWPDLWVPLFPLFCTKTVMSLGINAETAWFGINLFLGMFFPWIMYGIASMVQDDNRISMLSALLIIFNPVVIDIFSQIIREPFYLVFCGGAIFFGLRGFQQKSYFSWAFCGISGALATLSRYESLEIMLILGIALFIFCIVNKNSCKDFFFKAVIFLSSYSIFIYLLSSIMQANSLIYEQYTSRLFAYWVRFYSFFKYTFRV